MYLTQISTQKFFVIDLTVFNCPAQYTGNQFAFEYMLSSANLNYEFMFGVTGNRFSKMSLVNPNIIINNWFSNTNFRGMSEMPGVALLILGEAAGKMFLYKYNTDLFYEANLSYIHQTVYNICSAGLNVQFSLVGNILENRLNLLDLKGIDCLGTNTYDFVTKKCIQSTAMNPAPAREPLRIELREQTNLKPI